MDDGFTQCDVVKKDFRFDELLAEENRKVILKDDYHRPKSWAQILERREKLLKMNGDLEDEMDAEFLNDPSELLEREPWND